MKGSNEMITKTPTQEELHKMYLQQQTPAGQVQIQAKREMKARFSKIVNMPGQIGIVRPLINQKTGETRYFIAE